MAAAGGAEVRFEFAVSVKAEVKVEVEVEVADADTAGKTDEDEGEGEGEREGESEGTSSRTRISFMCGTCEVAIAARVGSCGDRRMQDGVKVLHVRVVCGARSCVLSNAREEAGGVVGDDDGDEKLLGVVIAADMVDSPRVEADEDAGGEVERLRVE